MTNTKLKQPEETNLIDYNKLKKEVRRLEGEKKKIETDIHAQNRKLSSLAEEEILITEKNDKLIVDTKAEAEKILDKAKEKLAEANKSNTEAKDKVSAAESSKKISDDLIKSNEGKAKNLEIAIENNKALKEKLTKVIELIKDIL